MRKRRKEGKGEDREEEGGRGGEEGKEKRRRKRRTMRKEGEGEEKEREEEGKDHSCPLSAVLAGAPVLFIKVGKGSNFNWLHDLGQAGVSEPVSSSVK